MSYRRGWRGLGHEFPIYSTAAAMWVAAIRNVFRRTWVLNPNPFLPANSKRRKQLQDQLWFGQCVGYAMVSALGVCKSRSCTSTRAMASEEVIDGFDAKLNR